MPKAYITFHSETLSVVIRVIVSCNKVNLTENGITENKQIRNLGSHLFRHIRTEMFDVERSHGSVIIYDLLPSLLVD